MFRKNIIIAAVLSGMFVCALHSAEAAPKKKTVIAIPVRYRVVALMQDMARLRVMTLVSYQGDRTTASPTLHLWSGKRWEKLSVDDLASSQTKERVVLVGDEKTVPGVVVAAAGSGDTKVFRISSLDTATLVTKLTKLFELSNRELQWIAQRQGLQIKDLNADRRRYGRYGKPDDEKVADADIVDADEVIMPSPVADDEGLVEAVPAEPEFAPVYEEPLQEKGIVEKGM